MNVTKKNGKEVQFDLSRIKLAITKANKETHEMKDSDIVEVTNLVNSKVGKIARAVTSKELQRMIEDTLMKKKFYETARAYIEYRYQKELNKKQNTTDEQILSTVNMENEEVKQENSNKNPTLASTQRDYIAGLVSKDLTNRYLLDKDIVEAHQKGILHFHDADYFIEKIHNCCLINLEDVLQNGTNINGVMIEKPHKLLTATTIATQVISAVASNQHGGCSITLTHLAPFVRSSYIRYCEKYRRRGLNEELVEKCAKEDLHEEIVASVQTYNYQVNSMSTTNGQSPFITVFMYLNETEEYKEELALLIEEFLNQRILGMKNKKGVYVTPAFPKLIYVLEEDNIHENSKYYYLTELAAKCSAKRLVPDYISEKKMKELKEGNCFAVMGCRSCLSPWKDENGKYKFYGRFNQGVVTINLVDVALSAKGKNYNKDIDSFWSILDDRLELCHRALRRRHERLLGTPSDIAPILWQYGALARLQPGEKIDKLLYGGYSTISLGYAGLWECVYELTGHKLTEPEGKEVGLKIMQALNTATEKWKEAENIGYSPYGTPLESSTYKFAKCLQERFGIVEGVTDKNYITNSYHVKVTEQIDAFSKLSLESEFQELSTGGAISYIETANLQNNIPAVLSVIKFIYENIMYAELNTKSDYCQMCGYGGDMQLVYNKDHKLIWTCPNCGNNDNTKINIARRVCGYISTNDMNQGRLQEIKERVLHL